MGRTGAVSELLSSSPNPPIPLTSDHSQTWGTLLSEAAEFAASSECNPSPLPLSFWGIPRMSIPDISRAFRGRPPHLSLYTAHFSGRRGLPRKVHSVFFRCVTSVRLRRRIENMHRKMHHEIRRHICDSLFPIRNIIRGIGIAGNRHILLFRRQVQ